MQVIIHAMENYRYDTARKNFIYDHLKNQISGVLDLADMNRK